MFYCPPNPLPLAVLPCFSIPPAAASHESALHLGGLAGSGRYEHGVVWSLSPRRASGPAVPLLSRGSGLRLAADPASWDRVPHAVYLFTTDAHPCPFRPGPSRVRAAVTVACAGLMSTRVCVSRVRPPRPREWGARWRSGSRPRCSCVMGSLPALLGPLGSVASSPGRPQGNVAM